MNIEEGSRPWLLVPIYGPDLTGASAEISLVAEGQAPGEGDWHLANWVGSEAALLVGAEGAGGGAVEYGSGEYICRVRLTAGAERSVIVSGRVYVGAAASL